MNDWIDIGDDHAIRFIEFDGDPHAVIRYLHLRPDGKQCQGTISPTGSSWAKQFDNMPTWEIQSYEPLSCTPSLLCLTCGDHGFITNGKWVRA